MKVTKPVARAIILAFHGGGLTMDTHYRPGTTLKHPQNWYATSLCEGHKGTRQPPGAIWPRTIRAMLEQGLAKKAGHRVALTDLGCRIYHEVVSIRCPYILSRLNKSSAIALGITPHNGWIKI